jgi:hypothetical protein
VPDGGEEEAVGDQDQAAQPAWEELLMAGATWVRRWRQRRAGRWSSCAGPDAGDDRFGDEQVNQQADHGGDLLAQQGAPVGRR